MAGFESKRSAAQGKLQDDADTLLIVYQRGFADGKRAAQPEQERTPKVGDRVICLEDESLGEVVSLTAGGSPDITFDDGSRGTYVLREFAELFGYATPPQRPWQGLEIEEVQDSYNSDYQAQTRAVEAKLKERNT
jgi:hypothetical protein